MGIPSYYKRLIDSVSGLVRKTHPGSINWLWMDFNCMIYHCLRKPDTPVYPGEAGRIEWEKQFVDCVARYLIHIVGEVKPQKGVYIAVDGVVPMAKMRQQRLRRFKSVWLTAAGLNEGSSAWDTNSITPGTAFMSTLKKRLEQVCAKHKTAKMEWILSSSDEPGEGEHKLMDVWRKTADISGGHAVYGLDADLIVLSLLNARDGQTVWLFREQIESGVIMRDAVGDEFYCWLSIDSLRDHIKDQIGSHTIKEYCFAMSVLGNDFLPSSLSFKMREDGHDALLIALQDIKEPLLQDDESIAWDGFKTLVRWLAKDEEARVERFVGRKLSMANNYTGLPIGDNNWPLDQKEESVLVSRDDRGRYKLVPNWRDAYYRSWLPSGPKRPCSQYLYGVQWIWAYYTGQNCNVCFNWFYQDGVPPLWADLQAYLCDYNNPFPGTIQIRREDIRPIEQLCLVLPLESWNLISHGANERRLVERAPWLFPDTFGFSSVGKRFFWECEAEIPVPSICEVKAILA
jgi:5'-3' exonuclease